MAHFGEDVIVRFTGSTHDEQAYITKNPDTVNRLNRHLERKIESNRDEIEMGIADLEDGATTLLLSYGVTAGAMREAVFYAQHSIGQPVICATPIPIEGAELVEMVDDELAYPTEAYTDATQVAFVLLTALKLHGECQ